MKLSAVITRRQDEMKLVQREEPGRDPAVRKKESENLFKRILNYFASKTASSGYFSAIFLRLME